MMTQDEWHESEKKWVLDNCIPQGTPENNTGWLCKECKVEMQGRGKRISLHLKELPMGGFGEVVEIIEPYCPKCGKCYSAPPFLYHGGLRDLF